jgi:hypothetical protein
MQDISRRASADMRKLIKGVCPCDLCSGLFAKPSCHAAKTESDISCKECPAACRCKACHRGSKFEWRLTR